MATHTPGPWISQRDPDAHSRDDYVVGIGEGAPIDYVATCSARDARLIAASPDLLVALEQAHMALLGYLPAHRNAVTDAAINAARAAIAKATAA